MTQNSIEWKRRATAMFAPLREIDRSWLPDSLRLNQRLLDAALLGQTTRRMICRFLLQGDPPAVDAGGTIPAWAGKDPATQRRMVLSLGALACSTAIKHTIEQTGLVALRAAVDEQTYRQALAQDSPLIRDKISDEYDRAMRAGDVLHFLAAMGMSVLLSATPQDEAFVRQNLRYLFSTKAWSLRRSDLLCDNERVIGALEWIGDE